MIARRPTRRDLPAILLGLHLALLFGAALWLRLTSLEALPEPNGDESWYGVQASRIIRGQAFAVRTPNGNPLNPFHVGVEALLLLAVRPSFWVLRISSAAAGIAAVVLAYRMGARVLDRTTATIAAALLAALPIAILYARIGYDCSQTPLFGVLALCWAASGRGARMTLGFALCLIAHPSNVFLLPALLAVYLTRIATTRPLDRRALWGAFATTAATVAMAAGLALYQRRLTREFLKIRKYEPGAFVRRFANLLVAGTSDENRVQVAVVLAVVAVVAIAGAWKLARGRRWERLAILLGPALAALASFAAVGSDTIRPIEQRYGLFLIAPTAFAMAVAVRALLVEPIGLGRIVVRRVQVAGLFAAGWALLACFAINHCTPKGPPLCFTLFQGPTLPPRVPFAADSPWSFRTDRTDPKAVAFRLILRDLDRLPPARRRAGTLIMTQDWWTHRPLQYLAADRPEITVIDYTKAPPADLARIKARFHDRLHEGAYIVCYTGQFLERFLQDEYPPDQVVRREVVAYGGPYLSVLRLKDDRDAGGPAVAATRADRLPPR